MDTSEQVSIESTRQEKRRRRSVEEKLRIVEETLEAGASVARVARRHAVNDVYSLLRSDSDRGILPSPGLPSRTEMRNEADPEPATIDVRGFIASGLYSCAVASTACPGLGQTNLASHLPNGKVRISQVRLDEFSDERDSWIVAPHKNWPRSTDLREKILSISQTCAAERELNLLLEVASPYYSQPLSDELQDLLSLLDASTGPPHCTERKLKLLSLDLVFLALYSFHLPRRNMPQIRVR